MGEKTQKIQKYKTDAINSIKECINENKDLLFTDFRGLTVEKITEVRKQLRQQASMLKVVKNNFTRIALSEINYPEVDSYIEGPTAIAFIKNDPSAVAKILFECAKNDPITIKGGIIAGRVLDASQVETLSRLPGRDQLIAMLMGTMNAPVKNLMYAMNGVMQKLVRTIKAVEEKKAKES